MMSVVSCITAAMLANVQYTHTKNVVAGVSQFYLGIGRYAKVNSLTIPAGATVQVGYESIVGETVIDVNCTATRCTNQETFSINNPRNAQATCKVKDSTELPITDVSCVLIMGDGNLQVSNDITEAVTPETPYYFKSTGFEKRHFFIQINATAAGTLLFNARVKSPEDLYCVEKTDIEAFYEGEQYPQPSDSLVRTSTSVPAVSPNVSVMNNYRAFDLGISSAIELGCLHVFTTPLVNLSTVAECKKSEYGTDFAEDLVTNTLLTVSLRDTYPCTIHTNTTSDLDAYLLPVGLFGDTETQRSLLNTCCKKYTAVDCQAVNLQMSDTCLWNHQDEVCYPNYHSTSRDLKRFVGLNTSHTRTFQALRANTPKSSLVADRDIVVRQYQVQNERKWHLIVENPLTEGCSQAVDVSFTKTNTGGICEPSARKMCDMREQQCIKSQGINQASPWPVFWDFSNKDDDEYKTCNCLKQKEVCYRKNGCLSTKKYELILQNCLEAGCQNYCNSGAPLQLSMAALLLALSAMLL
eukprot:TRINITY_DN529_c0_g2_i1.p1 TRINITY_DN529_c0_g2~~TRINITY_DN529_c0_g2_i1.p1  ORF type:complete len:550 (+),score=236.57 TRINITY_DN529_c0_g2_i1:80-1651(+)